MKNNSPEKIDDLVSLLDQFMENGGGHMNISAELSDSKEENTFTVDTKQTNECNTNMACSIPTIHQGIDDSTEEEPTI